MAPVSETVAEQEPAATRAGRGGSALGKAFERLGMLPVLVVL